MFDKPKTLPSLTRAALGTAGAQVVLASSVQLRRVARWLYALIGLLALSSTALAQVDPALPGSVEYELTSQNDTWFQTSDPISLGMYVEDLLSDVRYQQPVGRGRIGIVTEIDWDPWPYDQWAATVDFGRDYSAGLVFSELSAVQIVPIPEPSSLLVLVSGVLLARAVLSARRRAKANS